MQKKKLFIRLATLVFFIFLFNYIANSFYWYSSIWYFDMIMHFLGGFWLGLSFLWLFPVKDISFLPIFKILLGVLVIGLGWEVYEIIINESIAQNPFNTLDSISDIFFDLAGGFLSIVYFFKRIMFRSNDVV